MEADAHGDGVDILLDVGVFADLPTAGKESNLVAITPSVQASPLTRSQDQNLAKLKLALRFGAGQIS